MTVSIHVPLAEHDGMEFPDTYQCVVSIHVPLAEHDEETGKYYQMIRVSIHVPLAEHDVKNQHLLISGGSFNSRAPRGARRISLKPFISASVFQFTCPSRSTTALNITV